MIGSTGLLLHSSGDTQIEVLRRCHYIDCSLLCITDFNVYLTANYAQLVDDRSFIPPTSLIISHQWRDTTLKFKDAIQLYLQPSVDIILPTVLTTTANGFFFLLLFYFLFSLEHEPASRIFRCIPSMFVFDLNAVLDKLVQSTLSLSRTESLKCNWRLFERPLFRTAILLRGPAPS